MERLYCPECGNYLEGGDGSMVDCHCGWKQERAIESDEEELETLRQRVAELEATCVDHGEIQKALCDRVAELEKERDRLSELCDKWNFECDDMREDNNRLANVVDALKQHGDELAAALWIAEPVMEAHAGPSRLADFRAAIASVKEK